MKLGSLNIIKIIILIVSIGQCKNQKITNSTVTELGIKWSLMAPNCANLRANPDIRKILEPLYYPQLNQFIQVSFESELYDYEDFKVYLNFQDKRPSCKIETTAKLDLNTDLVSTTLGNGKIAIGKRILVNLFQSNEEDGILIPDKDSDILIINPINCSHFDLSISEYPKYKLDSNLTNSKNRNLFDKSTKTIHSFSSKYDRFTDCYRQADQKSLKCFMLDSEFNLLNRKLLVFNYTLEQFEVKNLHDGGFLIFWHEMDLSYPHRPIFFGIDRVDKNGIKKGVLLTDTLPNFTVTSVNEIRDGSYCVIVKDLNIRYSGSYCNYWITCTDVINKKN